MQRFVRILWIKCRLHNKIKVILPLKITYKLCIRIILKAIHESSLSDQTNLNYIAFKTSKQKYRLRDSA